jgi:CheY-like chemotaxis protein
MIIIDRNAETELMATLEKYRAELTDARCLYFSLDGNLRNIHATLIDSARNHLLGMNPQIFICEDGDVVILGRMPAKAGRAIMLDMVEVVGKPISDEWVIHVELPTHLNKLFAAIEPKVEAQRKAEEAQRRMQEQQLAARKRQAILNHEALMRGESIHARRNERDHPEFMIIEDDVFSQRLVENVLQKRYAMTGLKEATRALDTYARLAPDLLFLDINLPDVTGHELLERIMEMDPEAYVIVLSGNADKDNVMQALARGAKGFVAKPFNRERLLHYVDRCPTIQH